MNYITGGIIGGLMFLLTISELRNLFQYYRYMKMIDSLTEKVMSKNYQDYASGQLLKKDEPMTTRSPMTDEIEAQLEEEKNIENERLEKKLKTLDKGLKI